MKVILLSCRILLLGSSLVLVPAANAATQDDTGRWVRTELLQSLHAPPDLNRVASLVFPLTSHYRPQADPAVDRVLDETHAFLANLDPHALDCGALADLYLLGGFLRDTGRVLDTAEAQQRLAACDRGSTLFEQINALIFYCRYTELDHEEKLPGALSRIEASQRADGSLPGDRRQPAYYVTSHALLALYYCGGEPEAIRRAQGYLLDLLPRFRERGYLDALAEGLIFLRWMEVPVPGYQGYLEYLTAHVRPDGGLCLVERPGCRSHWHASSLWLELLNQAPP